MYMCVYVPMYELVCIASSHKHTHTHTHTKHTHTPLSIPFLGPSPTLPFYPLLSTMAPSPVQIRHLSAQFLAGTVCSATIQSLIEPHMTVGRVTQRPVEQGNCTPSHEVVRRLRQVCTLLLST